MAYELGKLELPIDAAELRFRIEVLLGAQSHRFQRLWTYFRNPMLPRAAERDEQGSDRPYRQGQEWGLPSRVTGVRCGSDPALTSAVDGVARKEVVIENDIGWRVETMIDFLFGQPIHISSTVSDPARRAQIEQLLEQILEQHGGGLFLQQIALLGAVYGFVDVLVKFDPAAGASASPAGNESSHTPMAESAPRAGMNGTSPHLGASGEPGASYLPSLDAPLKRIAQMIRLEVVEPARALPVLSCEDWREVVGYGQVYRIPRKSAPLRVAAKRGLLDRFFRLAATRSGALSSTDDSITITELITATHWQHYEDERLVAEGANSLGELPLVHIQNLALPFQYAGASDVESLISLQDELNTRLSDRGNRITLQSFKMYLGKGIDGFTDLPVAPGRMWMTDNVEAEVIQFGGDSANPSEDEHIEEIREAMDKVSGVTPIAAGAIRGRIGNLTSAAALRVTMMSLLAKTQRKRTTYGQAIARMCELALAWLDKAGLFHTTPDEREVEIHWPTLLPDAELDRLREAQAKLSLGVPRETILGELGYVAVTPPTPSPGTPGEGGGEGSVPISTQLSNPTEPSP